MFLVTIIFVSPFPPALLAHDLPCILPTAASGDQSLAASDSSLRCDRYQSGTLPAQIDFVHQEPSSAPTSASTSVTDGAPPKRLFSHTKWEGPAAVVPHEPDLNWKGAFHTVRRAAPATDSSVVQTSAELPLDAVQPVMLPNPPQTGLSDSPALTPTPPQATQPPLPVQVAPATEPNAAPLPSLEQQLAEKPMLAEKCITPRDLKSIRQIAADIGVKPEDLTGSKRLPPECSLGDTPLQPRRWHRITFAWTAASTCHNPLYFEEEQLERYGHSWGPVKQTAASAIQFFATVPLVPYFMGVYPPNECIYDLGQYQPGSCAPYYLDPLPLSVRGALYEGTFLGLLPTTL